MPALDGVASIVIGLLLCGVASLLIVQSRRLLVGVAVDTPMAREIRRIATDEREVLRSAWPLTMYLGPEEVLLALDVEFRPEAEGEAIQQAVLRIEHAIRQRYPEVRRIYVEAHRITRLSPAESLEAITAEANAPAHALPSGAGPIGSSRVP